MVGRTTAEYDVAGGDFLLDLRDGRCTGLSDVTGHRMGRGYRDYGVTFKMPLNGSTPPPLDSKYSSRADDPEKTPDMQKLWDAWHKQVADTVYKRFQKSALEQFNDSPPLVCQVSYAVAKDGRIGNVRVLQPSINATFDTMVLNVIHSIAGNALLEFPPESKRQFVEKTGIFTWHYTGGKSFRYDLPPEQAPQIGPPQLSK